jgi:hypothetical protein
MPEGAFYEFLQKENHKRLKLFVENPEWKKMFVSLFVVASDEANRLSCSVEELEITGQVLSPTLSSMSWAMWKKEKTADEKYEALLQRNLVIETKHHKSYTLDDILTKDIHALTMMSPGNTKQFMGCMDRVIMIKGMNAAMKAKFGIPFKSPDERFRLDIHYKAV